jgi:hypothetical protein
MWTFIVDFPLYLYEAMAQIFHSHREWLSKRQIRSTV